MRILPEIAVSLFLTCIISSATGTAVQRNMLPLSLLNAAQNKPMLVELKNGSTFNGHLVACDNFMNLTLREVYETSASGEQFWKQKECYIRGSTIKYCRVADSVIDQVKETEEIARKQRQQQQHNSHTNSRDGSGGQRGGRGGYNQRGAGRGGGPGGERGARGAARGGSSRGSRGQ